MTGQQNKAPYTEKELFPCFSAETIDQKIFTKILHYRKTQEKSLFCIASGKGKKAMQKYYNLDSETVITIDDVKKAYEEDDSWKEEYGNFDYYLECCQDYNNGSLTRLEIYIQRLENLLNKYSKYPENDNTELILEIERLKKEL